LKKRKGAKRTKRVGKRKKKIGGDFLSKTRWVEKVTRGIAKNPSADTGKINLKRPQGKKANIWWANRLVRGNTGLRGAVLGARNQRYHGPNPNEIISRKGKVVELLQKGGGVVAIRTKRVKTRRKERNGEPKSIEVAYYLCPGELGGKLKGKKK